MKLPPEFDKKVGRLNPSRCTQTTCLSSRLVSGGHEENRFAGHKTVNRQKGHRARWLRGRGRHRVCHGPARGPEPHRKHDTLFPLSIVGFISGRATDPRSEKNANQPDRLPYVFYPSLYDSPMESLARGTRFTCRCPIDFCGGKGRNAQGKGKRSARF